MIKLKELRESKHLSQQRLAIDLNVSQATVSKYELGQAEPDIPTIIKLAGYFHVSADYLCSESVMTSKTSRTVTCPMPKDSLFSILNGLIKRKRQSFWHICRGFCRNERLNVNEKLRT